MFVNNGILKELLKLTVQLYIWRCSIDMLSYLTFFLKSFFFSFSFFIKQQDVNTCFNQIKPIHMIHLVTLKLSSSAFVAK